MRKGGPNRVLLATLLGALVSAPAAGEPGAASGPEPAGSDGGGLLGHLLRTPRLADDPGGLRSRLETLGISLQLFYHQTLAWKPRGGVNPASSFGHSATYDLFARIDFEELVGWPGLDFLLHLKGQYDRNINPDVGALSDPIDDADFDEPIYVDELWLEQAFLRDRARLRLGFLEQQTVFDRNAYANSEDRQFLSTFLDNNPVVPIPNGLAAVLMLDPTGWLGLATGAADADNLPRQAGFDTAFDDIDGVTSYLELVLRSKLPTATRPLPGAYRLGVFLDGREKLGERGHVGAYASFDQLAFRERPEAEEGLGLFARFGYADEDVNRIAWFWSLGFQYLGLVPGRGADVLGLAVYQAIGSEHFRQEDPDFQRETGIECYYRVALLPWLAVTPDFQYIIDPGGMASVRNAVVVALRFRVAF